MADISKIAALNGSTYNLKDTSAIASIAKTSTGISYTTRAGSTKTLDGLVSPLVVTASDDCLTFETTGYNLDIEVNSSGTTITFTVV